MSDNKSAEETLLTLVLQSAGNDDNSLDMDAGPSTVLNHVTLDMIKKLLSWKLKAFLHVRFSSTKEISVDRWRRYGIKKNSFQSEEKLKMLKWHWKLTETTT
eukprot:3139402-Ditylum_brightwellii.AAC.1